MLTGFQAMVNGHSVTTAQSEIRFQPVKNGCCFYVVPELVSSQITHRRCKRPEICRGLPGLLFDGCVISRQIDRIHGFYLIASFSGT